MGSCGMRSMKVGSVGLNTVKQLFTITLYYTIPLLHTSAHCTPHYYTPVHCTPHYHTHQHTTHLTTTHTSTPPTSLLHTSTLHTSLHYIIRLRWLFVRAHVQVFVCICPMQALWLKEYTRSIPWPDEVVVEIFVHDAVKATVTNAPQSQLNK